MENFKLVQILAVKGFKIWTSRIFHFILQRQLPSKCLENIWSNKIRKSNFNPVTRALELYAPHQKNRHSISKQSKFVCDQSMESKSSEQANDETGWRKMLICEKRCYKFTGPCFPQKWEFAKVVSYYGYPFSVTSIFSSFPWIHKYALRPCITFMHCKNGAMQVQNTSILKRIHPERKYFIRETFGVFC